MPSSRVTGRVLRSPAADQLPIMSALLSPSGPITAIDFAEAARGRAPSFLSSTIDLRATSRAASRKSRSEEHTSELQSLMRISYAVFCLKKKKKQTERQKNSCSLL